MDKQKTVFFKAFFLFSLLILFCALLALSFCPAAKAGGKKDEPRIGEAEIVSFVKDFYLCFVFLINTDDKGEEIVRQLGSVGKKYKLLIPIMPESKKIEIFFYSGGDRTLILSWPKEELLTDKLVARKAAEEVFRYLKEHLFDFSL